MIRPKTLDLIDSDLQASYKKYLDMEYKDRLKIFTHELRIDPRHSEDKYREIEAFLSKLSWNTFKYSEACKHDLPKEIDNKKVGIYFFTVKPKDTIMQLPCYVLYVGISGEHGSRRPLKDRLCEYLRLETIRKRSNIHTMLQLYYKEAYINYSYYSGKYQDLERLEELLHEYFNPKFALRDYEPPTKQARKAWGT